MLLKRLFYKCFWRLLLPIEIKRANEYAELYALNTERIRYFNACMDELGMNLGLQWFLCAD